MAQSPERTFTAWGDGVGEEYHYLDRLDVEAREQMIRAFAEISGEKAYRLIHLKLPKLLESKTQEQLE